MNYLLLLAGGSGTRMKNKNGVPKQFLAIRDKPIIIMTLGRMIKFGLFERIIIVCRKDYIQYMQDLLHEYDISGDNIYITAGGATRLESAVAGCKFIEHNFGIAQTDIFAAHDAVRPFVTKDIISQNLEACAQYGAATTVTPLVETISMTDEDGFSFKTFPREHLYSGQSPQTFNIATFLSDFYQTPSDFAEKTTDLIEILLYHGRTVKTVAGERDNIKITTPFDLKVAEAIIDQK